MKKVIVIFMFVFLFGLVSSVPCDLDVSMLNQDPYPAVPGDYVEVVFQINGVQNLECGDVTFSLVEKYPISFDPGQESVVRISSGTYTRDYSSFLMIPYKIRVDEHAVDGDNPIEVVFSNRKSGAEIKETKEFNLNIKEVRADFEIFVKEYDSLTNTITFEVLNIAKSDVEALTLEIPKQDNVVVKGSNRNILGDLDSNEYTSADFEAVAQTGEIKINIFYTDSAGIRRESEETVLFDLDYFENRNNGGSTNYYWIWIVILVLGAVIFYFHYRIRKKRKHVLKHAHH